MGTGRVNVGGNTAESLGSKSHFDKPQHHNDIVVEAIEIPTT